MAAIAVRAAVLAANKIKLTNLTAVSCRNNANKVEEDASVTHTGQKFEDGDYRLVRFLDTPKQINTRFAIDLIADVPPQAVQARSVWCDGGDGALGHPRVFINLDKPGNHTCGYCGLRFYQHDSH